ncbi:MAG: hypothetical protein ACOYOP_00530 [Microthrixaceae bacterium]
MLGTVLQFHTEFAWMVIIGNALAGLWCLGAHWIPALRVKAMWWFVIFAELTIFLQVILGVYMVAGEGIEAPQFHMFYGFVAIITVALLYSYRNQIRAWQYLLYGLGGLFLMGLGIRAMLVGM